MASFKNIPIVKITKSETDNISDFMEMKYSFVKITPEVVMGMMRDAKLLELMQAKTEVAEEMLDDARRFLRKEIERNMYLIDNSPISPNHTVH